MNSNTNILISGGGIAGLTLAFWLKQFGFAPTVVEKRPDFSDRGYMIDFYGSGYDVAEKMGLLDPLKSRHNPISSLDFVDSQGKVIAVFQIRQFQKLVHWRHFNFPRGDLEEVLYEAVRGQVSVRFGCSIEKIQPQPEQVTVTLNDGSTETYDLVIGADGIHSNTRQLIWDPEEPFIRYLGYYVACAVIPNFIVVPQNFYTYLQPNRHVSVYPIRQNQLATMMIFPSEKLGHLSHEQQLQYLDEKFQEMGWVVPEILRRTRAAPSLYFDSISQVKLDPWYKERVALVGDACQCLTLLAGQGASMAMAGAYILADALRQADGDYQTAFPAYQARLKPEIDQRQRGAAKLASSFVPRSPLAIRLAILFLKLTALPGLGSLLFRQAGTKSVIK